MRLNPILEATKAWIESIKEYYKDTDDLNQIFMRGYFAGWSEREVLELANRLSKNQEDYPLN